MPHTDAIVVLTTVASDEEGVRLVRALLERRLIACGTLVPGARSLYRWQGKIADEREVVVILKTRSARLETLQAAFGELHPYKVPELLALPVSAEKTPVVLLFAAGTKSTSYRIPCLPRTMAATTLAAPLTGVIAGNYLVSIEIDGVASLLDWSDGTYTGPRVMVPGA